LTAFLGLDLGTTCVRAGVVSDSGTVIAIANEPLVTHHDAPGRAEQDARLWWPAVCAATRRAMTESGLAAAEIAGIGACATSSTVVLLNEDRPIAPAVLWMDVRAADEAAATAIDHPVLRYSGGSDAAEWLVPKAMWFRRHEPDTWAGATRVVEAIDYLTFRLTRQWVGSVLTATCKWNYDPVEGRFDRELFASLGVPDLIEKLPDRIAPVGSVAGPLDAAAATDLDLLPGIPVAVGGIDAHMALPGTGAMGDGTLCMIGGTSIVLMLLSDRASYGRGIWGPYPDVFGPGTWLLEGGQVSAGSILTWFRNLVGHESHESLMAAAEAVPPGMTGLLSLDSFQGNRTPYRDDHLRGGVIGLSLHHGAGHVYRALVEGIAFGTRNAVEAIEVLGGSAPEVVVAGGIRRNRVWLQATADVLQRPIVLTSEPEASLLGAAVAAAVASGSYSNLAAASSAMARRERVVEPVTALRAVYEEGFARYTRVVGTLAATMHELAHQADEASAGGGGQDS
jgi:ribulose kinase